jgi:hypothetical protein
MDSLAEIDRVTILRVVRTWTDDERLSLVQDVLHLIRTDRTAGAHAATFEQARGLLKTDRPPPTDAEVQQWLDERRMERYGA